MKGEIKKKKHEKGVSISETVVDLQGLALALGISAPTVRARFREGMPCLQEGRQGRPWRFDLPACIKWHTERAVTQAVGEVDSGLSKPELERLIMMEDLKLKRVNAAKALGEVALVEDMERALAGAFVDVRQAMLALPERVALRVLASDDETEVKEILEGEIDLALSSLAETDVMEEIANE